MHLFDISFYSVLLLWCLIVSYWSIAFKYYDPCLFSIFTAVNIGNNHLYSCIVSCLSTASMLLYRVIVQCALNNYFLLEDFAEQMIDRCLFPPSAPAQK